MRGLLTEGGEMVDMDRKRQANREAVVALRHLQPAIEEVGKEQKLWFCTGSLFLRLPLSSATTILQEGKLA